MAYTTMKTWTSETLTSSDMTTYLTNNIEYLYGTVSGLTFSGTELKRTSAQTIGDSTWVPIVWQQETYDYGGWWSSGSAITVPTSAIPSGYTTIAVDVEVGTNFEANGTGLRSVRLLVNGTQFAAYSVTGLTGDVTECSRSARTVVAAGDVVTAEVRQTSGGSLTISGTNTIFSIARRAPVA